MPVLLLALLAGPAHAPAAADAAPVHTHSDHDGQLHPRVPALGPGALFDLAVLGAGVFVEVIEDDPVTFGLFTAGGTVLGLLALGVGCAALGGGVAYALLATGTLTGWPLLLVVAGPALVGAGLGLGLGLVVGGGLGFWASVDEGELSLSF